MKIDLAKGIGLEVGGELGKDNTISIDVLFKLVNSFQELIKSVAKHNISQSESIVLDNFKICLSGFEKHSAVPIVKFESSPQGTVHDLFGQRTEVTTQLEKILEVSDKGNYIKLRDLYPSAFSRNEIIEPLYQFANSTGNSPLSIVNFNKKKISEQFKIRHFKSEIKTSLFTKISDSEKGEKSIYSSVAKIDVVRAANGEIKNRKIKDVYEGDKFHPSFTTDTLVFGEKVFEFIKPLTFTTEKEDEIFSVKSDVFEISGCGDSVDEAEHDLAEELNFLYNSIMNIPDKELTQRLQSVKQAMKLFIK